MFFSKAKDAVLREQEAFYDDGRGPVELGKCWEDFLGWGILQMLPTMVD
jgi:hypothetical protein